MKKITLFDENIKLSTKYKDWIGGDYTTTKNPSNLIHGTLITFLTILKHISCKNGGMGAIIVFFLYLFWF